MRFGAREAPVERLHTHQAKAGADTPAFGIMLMRLGVRAVGGGPRLIVYKAAVRCTVFSLATASSGTFLVIGNAVGAEV